MTCECGKEAPFEQCCGRFLESSEQPATAEELMRSRFVAFGLGNFDYIEATQVEPLPEEVRNREEPEWESLEVLECVGGGPDESTGTVKFAAVYKLGQRRRHCELSRFVRVDGQWRYQDGDIEDEALDETPQPKVGRNERCPCGSGRKFKRCCGV